MALQKVKFEQIINALNTFDRDYRYSDEFIGWEMRQNQKYAIQYEGKLYPPKMIISLATGVPRSEFCGGQQSNKYLCDYGLEVIELIGRDNHLNIRPKEHSGKVAKDENKTDGWMVSDSYGGHREMVREIYKILKNLPRFNFFTDMRRLPDNGIYFFFELGESNTDGLDRLVRIGTHRSDGRLKKRIRQHYRGNRNSSVFRKHLGGAMINRECPDRACLENWLNNDGNLADGLEARVSRILEQNFYFTCIEVKQAEERLILEEGLIALFAGDVLEKASGDWLGNDAASKRIRKSSLWNSEHVEGNVLTEKQLDRLVELAEVSRLSYDIETEPKALVLIPCCKSKAAVFSEHWSPPFSDLQQARTELLEKIDLTEGLANKDCNLGGILNPYSHVTRALDLYVGNFYYAAGNALEQVVSGNIVGVDVLIVSACYGLLLPNEGIKRYELQMSDSLEDGMKVYKYWQNKGLSGALGDYVTSNEITTVWSLLPNSMPSFPYQQVFNVFWKESKNMGVDCYHVSVPDARSSSGYQRARWLQSVMDHNPELLLNVSRMPLRFSNIPDYEFKYISC